MNLLANSPDPPSGLGKYIFDTEKRIKNPSVTPIFKLLTKVH